MLKFLVFVTFLSCAYGFLLDDLETKIVGGETAPDGRAPYQVSLRSLFGSHFCGASILNERWILTAAHCTVYGTTNTKVWTGTNSLTFGGNKYNVEKKIVHEKYSSFRLVNDIALLRVSADIIFGDKVQPISLPEEDTGADMNLMLTGWGTTTYPGSVPADLQMINLTSLSVPDCQKRFKGIMNVYDTQICSLTKKGEGACHGDSGGPLVENNSIVGIVSWGMPCARGYPDVYTRVYAYKDWIINKINDYEMENSPGFY